MAVLHVRNCTHQCQEGNVYLRMGKLHSGNIPGPRFPGGGNGNPLQCFCLGNPMDRGAYHRVIRVGHDLAPNHHHYEVETIARTFLWKVNPVTKTLLRLHGANKCQSQDVNPSSLIPESTLLITILAVSLPHSGGGGWALSRVRLL